MTRYLELPQAVGILEDLGLHIRDIGLLSSALARPSSSMFGVEAYPTIEVKAASLLSSLSQNHPLFDGNKRFSWIMTMTFLELNGVLVDMGLDAAFDLVLSTAQSKTSLDEIAAALRAHTR
ncbi:MULTISPECIES: type II toxin-antitoxin system death-on-curing family toxin [Microbacterium]|uniref:Death on curing protein n=1 Tax=Microbacterium hydrocarbonoxydans TaxID=273678 RepID=A0A1H4J1P5_9MICO|nr:type II toxin-antitoxin system death-on-curing family toxin [Microbacterium hydrocarbonoxydans]SEB39886.1 death on curing protein [Microbacterium hydrocarbonoxydans]